MALAPYGFKVDLSSFSIGFRRQRQIDLRAQGGISLIDAGTDSPAGSGLGSPVSGIRGRKIVHRIIHVQTHIHGIAQRVLLRKILRNGRFIFAALNKPGQDRVKVGPAAIAVAEKDVFSLGGIQLVKGGDSL